MRASAKWQRQLTERFAPREGHRGVAHLRHYACEYLVAGQGDPVLLVPGLAGGYELVGRLMRALSRHFQVISYQLRGEHDPLLAHRSHELGDLAGDLADLQSALLLERPAVVGISFGSAVAMEFALRYPHQAGPLILHGLEPRFGDSLAGRIARLALNEFPLPHDNPFFNQFFNLLFAPRESAGPLFEFVTAQCWQTEQSVMSHRLSLLAGFDVRHRAARVTSPTLVLAGNDDFVVPAARQRALAQLVPNARFVSLTAAGHLCFLTRPQAFARTVAEFLFAAVPPDHDAAPVNANA